MQNNINQNNTGQKILQIYYKNKTMLFEQNINCAVTYFYFLYYRDGEVQSPTIVLLVQTGAGIASLTHTHTYTHTRTFLTHLKYVCFVSYKLHI